MATSKRLGTAQSESNISVNSRLSEAKKEKLLNIKRREDLKDSLNSKFHARYAHGGEGRADDEVSVASSAIKREVDRFSKTAGVTEANLGRLERRLQRQAEGRPEADASSASGVSAYSAGGVSRLSKSHSQGALQSVGENVVLGGKRSDYDWGKLDEYAIYLHRQDAMRQKQGVMALQRKLKQDLDNQVAEHNRRKNKTAEEEKQYFQHQCEDIQAWKESEQQKADELKAKVMREKRDRDEQYNLEQSLKAAELEKKKAEEAALVEKIVKEMEGERKAMEKKKIRTRQQMRKVFEENAVEERAREEEKRQMMEKEAEAIKEYNRLLDKHEEDRAHELAARVGKQKELMEKMKASMEAQDREKGDEDALRAQKQKAESDARYDEMETKKQARLRQMKHETQDFLFKQMAEKDDKKRQAGRLKSLQAEILAVDTAEYNEIEEAKAAQRKACYRDHRAELEHQIAVNAAKKESMMSESEMNMNKQLLDLVDQTLEQRDREEAMNPAPRRSAEDDL